MPEKFFTQGLSQQKLKEGIAELEADDDQLEGGDMVRAHEIIDSFFVEVDEGEALEETDWSIEYALRDLSEADKAFVFKVWFTRDPSAASYWIHKFGVAVPVRFREAVKRVKEDRERDRETEQMIIDTIAGEHSDAGKLEDLYKKSTLTQWVRSFPLSMMRKYWVQDALMKRINKQFQYYNDVEFPIALRDAFQNVLDDVCIGRITENVKTTIANRARYEGIKEADEFAMKIRESFHLPNDFWREIALENIDLILKNANFFASYVAHEEMDTVYTNTIEKIKRGNDAEVSRNLSTLENILGTGRMKRLLSTTPTFWENPHDYLLFMGAVQSRSAQDQEQLKRIVFPLLLPGVDFRSFGQSLQSFDVNLYIKERTGAPFRTMQEFEREVQMQKMNIHIPDEASEQFQEAIQTLVIAPGVDVPFIRKLIDEYGRESHDSDFAGRLVNIIEGKDAIDERQHIRPWEKEIPFDPLHKVILTSIGIRGLNEQSVPLFDRLRNYPGLAGVTNALRAKDVEIVAALKVRRDELKAKFPEKAGHYDADFRVNMKKETILKFSSGDEPLSVRIENRDAYRNSVASEEWDIWFEQLKQAVLNDAETLESVSRVFFAVADSSRREMVKSFVDVEAGFFADEVGRIHTIFDATVAERKDNLAEAADDSRRRAAILRECARESVRTFLNDDSISKMAFVEFFLYLALNNRSRLEASKKILHAVSSVLGSRQGKEKYSEYAQAAGERDTTQAYLKGKLVLEEDDEYILREAYQSVSKGGMVRTLGVEIAKKSNPEGWVCGNYTDCCMPFTSGKNQEYLLREDMSYFLVSRNDTHGEKDIIGQSVLVYGEDETTITIALDNIEIANRAVQRGERAVVAQAYQTLKEHLIDTYGNKEKRLKIVIGTSYNDDGGLVTGECELKPVDAKPLGGKMQYSDWQSHASNYVLYDSEAEDTVQKYYGLSIDGWENSRVRQYITQQFQEPDIRREHERHIEDTLRTIGRGEDDGDGGLNFADNYSVVLTRSGEQVGYVIAADYLTEDNQEDLIHLEDMQLKGSLTEDEKKEIFRQYVKDKKLKKFAKKKKVEGLFVSTRFIEENPFALEVLKDIFVDFNIEEREGGIVLKK